MGDTSVYNEAPLDSLLNPNRGVQQRILANISSASTYTMGATPAAYYASNNSQVVMLGNIVNVDESDGYSLAQWQSSVAIGNNSYKSNQGVGDGQIQLNPANGANPGLVFVGNSAYLSKKSNAKLFGTVAPDYISSSSIVANTLYGANETGSVTNFQYATQGNQNNPLQNPNTPDSNVVYGNVDWYELQHSSQPNPGPGLA